MKVNLPTYSPLSMNTIHKMKHLPPPESVIMITNEILVIRQQRVLPLTLGTLDLIYCAPTNGMVYLFIFNSTLAYPAPS